MLPRRMWIAPVLLVLYGACVQAHAQRPPGPFRPKKAASPQARKQLDRLNKMTPAERNRFLSTLPPERRKLAEKRIEEYNKLTPQQREKLADRVENFQSLPPERQNQVRRLMRQFNDLPVDRKPLLRRELVDLRELSEEDRRARINSDEFRNKFTPKEQELLSGLSQTMDPEQE